MLLPFFFIFFVWFFVFWLASLVTFVWWPFIFLRYLARNFSFVWALAAILFGVALYIGVGRWSSKKVKERSTQHRPNVSLQRSVNATRERFERPFLAWYGVLMFGGWHLLNAYSLQQVLQEFGIRLEFLTMNVLLLMSVLWGLGIGAGFFAGFSLPAFASKNPRKRRLAWAEIITYTLVAYTALVIVYSTSVYWRMPDYIGGGRPEPISIWLDASGTQFDLNRQLPQAKCTREVQQWMCTSAYLLDASGDRLILVDNQTPVSNSLVIPKAKVRALAKQSG